MAYCNKNPFYHSALLEAVIEEPRLLPSCDCHLPGILLLRIQPADGERAHRAGWVRCFYRRSLGMAKFTFRQVYPWLCALEEKDMKFGKHLSFCQNLITHNSDLLKTH